MNWWGPVQIGATLFHPMVIPPAVSRVDAKGSFATGDRHCYMAGNFTESLVLTDDYRLWTQGIPAPTAVPTVSLSGTGITANLICYLRWYDEDSGEWSALSAPSSTLVAANQGVLWGSFPVPPSARVTHISGWRSVDGGLPRLVWTRQIGVVSVQESTALGDLGEAAVDEFELFPRCRFNVIWHERQVMAGDDEHPDTIYLSLIGDFEKFGFLTLKTKSGQAITGLLEVGGTLIVECRRAMEVVTGWTEDDLSIDIVQHGFGGVGHHAATKFHNYAMVWSNLGPYLTDGSGWWPMYKEIKTKWAEEYELRRTAYDLSFAAHDPVTGTVMLHVGPHSDVVISALPGGLEIVHPDTFWLADYSSVIPDVGGGYAQPFWGYDLADDLVFASAVPLTVPSGRRSDLYYGGCDGRIYRADPMSLSGAEGVSPGLARLRTGAMFFSDDGGDIAQGKKFVWIDMFVESEVDEWVLNLYGGDEHAFPAVDLTSNPAVVPSYTATVPGSEEVVGAIRFQAKTTHPFNLVGNRVIGRALVVEVKLASGEFRGFQLYWMEGETQRTAAYAVSG